MVEIPSPVILSLSDVTVRRGGQPIVAGAGFRLTPGEALVLTGPNGSGKTSLLRAIAGFCSFDGTIDLLAAGSEMPVGEPLRQYHFLGHETALNRRLAARAHLVFWQQLLANDSAGGLDPDTALARVGLADGPAWRLSAGQRQRLAMARLLVAPRPVWLLDEPVTALDPAGRAFLAELCDRHRAGGGIVLSSSHGLLEMKQARTLELIRELAA